MKVLEKGRETMNTNYSAQNFITVYDNVLPSQECQALINKFEANPQCQKNELKQGQNSGWKMQFTQINFLENEEFSEEVEKLQPLFLQAITAYKREHQIQPHQWPENFKLEPIRMKRYLPNTEDGFGEHVDVSDYASARRFLVFFIYLNDDFEGGETSFKQFNIKVKPKQGSLILFPPMWNWLHQAHSVKGENPKYIVGSYMHYV